MIAEAAPFADVVRAWCSRLRLLVLAPLLLRQGRRVVERMPVLPEASGERQGQVGLAEVPVTLRLMVLGESTAAGVGVDSQRDGLPHQLAAKLAGRRGLTVGWQVSGRTGATARYAARKLLPAGSQDQDVVILARGVNDALKLTPRTVWRTAITGLVDTVRADRLRPGGRIILSGVPDLRVFAVLPQPLRSVLGGQAWMLDRELGRIAAAAPDVVHVAMPELRWPEMFAADGFHPNAAAYRAWADQLADMCDSTDRWSPALGFGGLRHDT